MTDGAPGMVHYLREVNASQAGPVTSFAGKSTLEPGLRYGWHNSADSVYLIPGRSHLPEAHDCPDSAHRGTRACAADNGRRTARGPGRQGRSFLCGEDRRDRDCAAERAD